MMEIVRVLSNEISRIRSRKHKNQLISRENVHTSVWNFISKWSIIDISAVFFNYLVQKGCFRTKVEFRLFLTIMSNSNSVNTQRELSRVEY